MPALIEKYNKNADSITAKLYDVNGVRVQNKGRLASPQGYYGMVFLFDGEELKDIPIETILQACAAEGLNMGCTYGPVYHHMLFNLQDGEYSIPEGNCPVAEDLGFRRAAVLSHPYLGQDEVTVAKIGEIIAKVANNCGELK